MHMVKTYNGYELYYIVVAVECSVRLYIIGAKNKGLFLDKKNKTLFNILENIQRQLSVLSKLGKCLSSQGKGCQWELPLDVWKMQ